jgi:hypothetical protein
MRRNYLLCSLRWPILFLILPGLIILLAGEMAITFFAPSGNDGITVEWSPQSFATEGKTRLRLLGALLTMLVLTLWIIGKFTADLWSRVDRNSFPVAYAGIAICTACAIILISEDLVQSFELRKNLISSSAWTGAFNLAEQHDIGIGASTFLAIVTAGTVLGAIALAGVVLGAICCAGTTQYDPVGCLRDQIARLKTYTVLGAATLAVGIVFVDSWIHWPMFALLKEIDDKRPDYDNFAAVADSLTIYTGIQFSLVLADIVLPVAAILAVRANRVAYLETLKLVRSGRASQGFPEITQTAVAEMKQKLGLAASATDVLKSLLAILAPFLTSTLGTLIQVMAAAT